MSWLFWKKINMWSCIGDTHIGKSHIKNNLPCQDKIAYICNDKVTVCALCDGLGSRKYSHYGASIVSNVVVEFLSAFYKDILLMKENEFLNMLLDEINRKIYQFSNEHKIDISTLECTLLFALISDEKYLIGKIGDGVLGTFKEKSAVDNMFLSKGSDEIEYANSTYTILDNDAYKHLAIKKGNSDEIDSLFMISDGLPFLSSKGKTASKMLDFFQTMSESEKPFSLNIIDKEITRKVNESDYFDDDWSFIFVRKLGKKKIHQVKTFYTEQINDIEWGNK